MQKLLNLVPCANSHKRVEGRRSWDMIFSSKLRLRGRLSGGVTSWYRLRWSSRHHINKPLILWWGMLATKQGLVQGYDMMVGYLNSPCPMFLRWSVILVIIFSLIHIRYSTITITAAHMHKGRAVLLLIWHCQCQYVCHIILCNAVECIIGSVTVSSMWMCIIFRGATLCLGQIDHHPKIIKLVKIMPRGW